MSQPSSTENLRPGDWERLREAAEKLERAWRDQAEPDLASFLPPADDPLYGSILEELVKTDLEIRRSHHYDISLDDYLKKYPQLGEAANLPARLIYEEYRVLRRFGDPVDLEQYRRRFPNQFAELQRLISQQPIEPEDRTNLDSPSSSAEPPSNPPLPIGDILAAIGEGYRPIKCIGRGSFGEVWEVEAPGGFPAAVKIIRRTLDSEEAKRELRALEVIKRLSHPHLLKTQAAWPLQHWLVILMELADCTLRDRLRECKGKGETGIPVGELLCYLQEAAEALDYLHSEEVLHRDVKPANLLLCRGHVKVADFGLVRDQKTHRNSDSISGTPGYMAPEAWGRAPCAASDQYSLALTYAELRLGQWPFAVDDAPFLVHLEGTPDLARLSEAERDILLRGMAKSWKERFPTCQALVSALRDALLSDPAQHDLVAAVPSRPAAATRPMPRYETKLTSLPQKNDPGTAKKQAIGLFDTLGEPPQPASDTCETLAPSAQRVPGAPATKAARPLTAPKTRAMKAKVGKSWQRIGWAAVVLLVLVSLAVAIWHHVPPPPPKPFFELLDPQPEGVILSVGSRHPVSISIKRQNGFGEAVNLTTSVKGDGLSCRVTDIASDSDNGEVLFDVAADAAPGLRSVSVRASATGQQEKTTSLQVVILPFGFEPKGEGPTKWREMPYPSKIIRRVGRQQVEVVLVLIRPEGKKDAPFYLMENKVSNGMFRAFVAENPQAVAGSLWEQGGVKNGGNVGAAEDELPVFRLTRSEAERFAAWLAGPRGRLPRARQLDLAAGYYNQPWPDRTGPARGPLVAVATDRMQKGPRKINDTSDDISPYDIRDLAGNGREWTRDTMTAQGQQLAVLRGHSYTAPRPLSFDDIGKWINQPEQTCPVQHPDVPSWSTSFRVVLELADQRSGK